MSENDGEMRLILHYIQLRRYSMALGYLRASLFSKNAESTIRKRLLSMDKFRDMAFQYLKSLADKPIAEKLEVLDFFQDAFHMMHDVETALAMRYEALILEESFKDDYLDPNDLRKKWLAFANVCFQLGFTSISILGYEKAMKRQAAIEEDNVVLGAIKEQRDEARCLLNSKSVSVEANLRMRQHRNAREEARNPSTAKLNAAAQYMKGTRKRNIERLACFQARTLNEDRVKFAEPPL